jgi:hypothetical protein
MRVGAELRPLGKLAHDQARPYSDDPGIQRVAAVAQLTRDRRAPIAEVILEKVHQEVDRGGRRAEGLTVATRRHGQIPLRDVTLIEFNALSRALVGTLHSDQWVVRSLAN